MSGEINNMGLEFRINFKSDGNSKDLQTISPNEVKDPSAGILEEIKDLPQVLDDIFSGISEFFDFSPDPENEVKDKGASLERTEKAAKLVEKFASDVSGTDSAKLLARLMVELAGLQRKDALASKVAAKLQAKAELLSQADNMRESAKDATKAAIIGAVVAGVSAAFSAAAAGASIGGAAKNTKQLGQVSKLGKADGFDMDPNLNKTGKIGDIGEPGAIKQPAPTAKTPEGGAADIGDPGAVKQPIGNGEDVEAGEAGKPKMKVFVEKSDDTIQGDPAGSADFQIGMKEVGIREAKIQGYAGIANALASAGNGSGQAFASGAQQSSKFHDADATIDAAEQEAAKAKADGFQEVRQVLAEFIKHLMEALKDLDNVDAGQMRSITQG